MKKFEIIGNFEKLHTILSGIYDTKSHYKQIFALFVLNENFSMNFLGATF